MGALLAFPSICRDYTDEFGGRKEGVSEMPDEARHTMAAYEEAWDVKLKQNLELPFSEFLNADHVFPDIWLGGYSVAKDEQFLGSREISTVVNMAVECDYRIDIPGVRLVKIGIEDGRLARSGVFRKAAEVIHESLPSGRVFVHCAAGVSRSATAVLAYLNVYEKIGWADGVTRLRRQRPCVNPHPHLYRSLVRDIGSDFIY